MNQDSFNTDWIKPDAVDDIYVERELNNIQRGIIYQELVQASKKRLSNHETAPYPLLSGEIVQSQITLSSHQKVLEMVTLMSLKVDKKYEPPDQLLIVYGQHHLDLRHEWARIYIKFDSTTNFKTIQEASVRAVINSSLPANMKHIASLKKLVDSVKTWEEYSAEPREQ